MKIQKKKFNFYFKKENNRPYLTLKAANLKLIMQIQMTTDTIKPEKNFCWKGPLKSHTSVSYSEEVQLDQVAQSFLADFEYPKWLKVYKLYGQTLSVPNHLYNKCWAFF